jgi:threonine/homoserine/homoserine lactone efflux protein
MSEYITAFVFGMTLAIAVGPIAILIINRSLLYGFKDGFLSCLGASMADYLYGLLAFTIGSVVAGFLQENRFWFELVASSTLAIFGGWMLAGSLKMKPFEINNQPSKPTNPFLSTFLLTSVNPLTIVGFLGFSGQFEFGEFSWFKNISLPLTISLGTLLIGTCMSFAAASVRKFLTDFQKIKTLNIVSSSAILLFGLWGIVKVFLND